MILVIGGQAQGKGAYVKEHYGQSGRPVFSDFHLWVRNRLSEGGNPEQEILEYVDNHRDCIIISDEVGNGIVPIDAFEREYRERTGRLLVELARNADEVVRVLCGIGQRIK